MNPMPIPHDQAVRTSITDPLRVAWLETPPEWRVGLTFAPGKRGPSREGPAWERDLDADLDVLVGKGVRTIACLVEPKELVEWGIAGLPSAVAARGIELLHRPIRDVSVPTRGDARTFVQELFARRDEPILRFGALSPPEASAAPRPRSNADS